MQGEKRFNVVCILVDSVKWDGVNYHSSKASTTPFLDSLINESIVATKLYSQGPYTDAATKGLYTGRNTLDDFGYYFKLNTAPSTHFCAFHESGYETYGLYYPYYLIGSDIKQNIDHTYYTSGFAFPSSEWAGIYSYYADIMKKRELTNDEIALLSKRLLLMFDVWISFYEDCISDRQTCELIKEELRDFDISAALNLLKKERQAFIASKHGYINKMLFEKENHVLWNLDKINVDAYIDREYMEKNIYGKHHAFFSKVNKRNILSNMIYNRPGIRRIFRESKRYIKERDKDNLRFITNFHHCLRTQRDMVKHSYNQKWQYMPSAERQLSYAANVIANRNDKSRPFYLSVHLLEPHENINYFSYDMNDSEITRNEVLTLNDFVDSTGVDFKGSLPYLLSIRYTDYCIERFCDSIKQMGLWDNIILMVVADHGSSFSYYPLHNKRVNCFDDECYHIPMIIRAPSGKAQVVSEYHNSRDVFPTLFDVAGINKPMSFIGSSMLREQKEDYVLTEYMGPGCPDMLSRRIWFSIRDSRMIVAYKVGLYEDFEKGELSQVYNLDSDPYAQNDIHSRVNAYEIAPYLERIKKRYMEIKHQTTMFLSEVKRETN